MIALLRKETEAIAPYWLVIAALCGVGLATVLWDPTFVLSSLDERFSAGSSYALLAWMVAFLVGQSAVAHELRDGHIELLDGLPISRGTVFAAKALACALPILALVLGSFAIDVGLSIVCRPPDASSALVPVLVIHLVMLACGVAGLGSGMLLSWLGPLGWGVLALGLPMAMCANVLYPPSEAWLPLVGSLGALDWKGATASHPVGAPLFLAAGGLVAMGVSGGLFLGPGRYLTDRGSDAIAVVRAFVLACLFALALFVGGVSIWRLLSRHTGELWQGVQSMPSARGDFRLLHAPDNEATARRLSVSVDALSDRVALLVGHVSERGEPLPPSAGAPLDLELLGAPNHHAGAFTGGKIRLVANVRDDTVAHELAHAHAYALSGPGIFYQYDVTHFFEEGLADWVEAKISGRDPVPLLAGAIYATDQARFEDLVDRRQHLARHDLGQSYVLGAVFVSALVEHGGEQVLPCVLRELGRAGGRQSAGLALWYGIASACSFDLDTVQEIWSEQLQSAQAQIEGPLPRLRARMMLEGTPLLEVRDERDLGWRLVCAFRSRPDRSSDVIYQKAKSGVCEVPVGRLSGHSFQYQVGFRFPKDMVNGDDRDVLYLEWVDAPMP